MRKIEKRALVCLLLAGAMLLGLAVYVVQFLRFGGDWASFASNRHLYNSQGELAVGRVLDRDGDVLSWVENGRRAYYANPTVREATLHAVGDAQGKIGTGALVAFADKLSGYNLLTGAYSLDGGGNDLYLTLDARLNYIAYQALGGKKGAVGVYNYETGEVLCMVSTPTFDPANRLSSRRGTGSTTACTSTASFRAPLCPARCSRRSPWPPPLRTSPTCLSAAGPVPAPPRWGRAPSPAPMPTGTWTSTAPWPPPATACSPSWPPSWGRR